MKLKRGQIPSYQYMIGLLDKYYAGDESALQDARQISAQLAKRANVRLKALETSDYEASPAYMRVRDIIGEETGRIRFSESKKLTAQQLETQMEELSVFLRDESSTVHGEAMRRSGIDTMIESGTIEISDDRTKRTLLRFLESDEWNTYRKLAGYVKGSMQTIVNAIENGHTFNDFKKLYKEALNQQRPLSGLLEEWEEME